MKTRMIGGRAVGQVALGCMSFAGFYGKTSLEDSHACLSRALDLGITHWDVAEIYGMGEAERHIGSFLREHPADIHLATKAGIYVEPTRHFSNAPDRLRASLEGSLERLGRDHVDLFYIHRREAERAVEEVMAYLVTLVDEGLIGGIGFSEIAPATLRRAHAVHPVTAVQSEYSLWTRQPELGMLRACQDLGVTFVAFSPLARGMLTDTPPDPAAFGEADFRAPNPRFLEPHFSANQALIQPFREFCRAKGWPVSAAALAWTLDQGPHILPIPGTRTAAHLEELAEADRITFTDADRAEIDRLLPPGFAHGPRYSESQFVGVEPYC